MKDEDIIGQEFEGVKFESIPRLPFDSSYNPFMGKTGIVTHLHEDRRYCYVEFGGSIGIRKGIHFPTAVVKQQIEDRIPIDLDDLFNQIKSL
jgi:hypothetical protein